jgi:hypothetical protein
MMFRKYYIFILCFFFFEEAFAQVNLVPNPSFENLSQCPTFLSQLEYATPWFQPYPDTQESSTDLFSSCCSGFCGLINNSRGSQIPRTGNSYVGSAYYSDGKTNAREFIEVKLNDSLLSNKDYCLTFYISLAEKCKYATSNFGAYYSMDSCLTLNTVFPPPYTPQIENPFNNVITDKDNWIPMQLMYNAQGGENFITIGGFKPDSLSNIIIVDNSMPPGAYYYIDDVSVIDISTPAYAGNDTTITIGDSIFIGRQPEIGLNDDCVWYVNGNPIDTVAGLWVQPDSTTTYILEQTICGYTTYDTVTVTVLPTSINELFNSTNVSIYPNPNDGNFTITHLLPNENNFYLEIIDITGKIVHREKVATTKQPINTTQLSKGLYFVNFISEAGELMYSTKMSVVK